VETIKIRWYSRAGQGGITAASFLANIAAENNFFVQSFSEFGAEKRGAPVTVFSRISEKKIESIHPVLKPNLLVIMDMTLLKSGEILEEEIFSGVDQNCKILINAENNNFSFSLKNNEIFAVPASKIAIAELGKNIPNIAMLGAILKLFPSFNFDIFAEKISEKLKKIFPKKIFDGNLKAFYRGAKEFFKITSSDKEKKITKTKKNIVKKNWKNLPMGGNISSGNSDDYCTGNWSPQKINFLPKKCIQCGMCFALCPDGAIKIKDKKIVGVDKKICKKCGICVNHCPVKALEID